MEEANELAYYLPISFKTAAEQQYVDFLWDAFRTNYEHGKHQFAFLAYHMLTMCFVYFNVWQIKRGAAKDFEHAMIGFSKETESKLLEASSPFAFSVVNESTILRFLKLIDCDNAKIGTYAKLVKDRNDSAHSNGHIFFSNQGALDLKLQEVMRVVEEIQTHSKTMIERRYDAYLLGSCDPDAREYADEDDQNREVLVHENYLSMKDIEICKAHSLEPYRTHPAFDEIEALHEVLKEQYPDA